MSQKVFWVIVVALLLAGAYGIRETHRGLEKFRAELRTFQPETLLRAEASRVPVATIHRDRLASGADLK
jgi:hypothetical protein